MEKRENSLILKTNVANRYSFFEINIARLKSLWGFGIVKSTKKSSEYSYFSIHGKLSCRSRGNDSPAFVFQLDQGSRGDRLNFRHKMSEARFLLN